MRLGRLKRQCRRLLADVEVPDPFDLSQFLSYVAARRGRDLHLHPQPAPPEAGHAWREPCGLWLATDRADHVFYAAGTDPLHRRHIILHEVGHILCDHRAPGLVLSDVLLDLDPATVARVLHRSTYSAPQEQVAEMIATMINERAVRGPLRPPLDDPLLRGLHEALIPGPADGRR